MSGITRITAATLLSLSLAVATSHTFADTELSEAEVADIAAQPSIGLYKAYAEFKMARYGDARRIWEALAERGVAEAWFNLGILAEDGLGETRDVRRALELYERGAAGGSVKAQYRLALLHIEGTIVEPDRQIAEQWLEAAARGGHVDAARQLDVLRGGVEVDDYLAIRLIESEGRTEEAADAYRRLSEQGDLRARTRLAWMYETGRGVPRDLSKAAQLFESAAALGDAEAQFALSVMLRTGAGRPRDDVAARAWLLDSARAGYPEAVEALREERRAAQQ